MEFRHPYLRSKERCATLQAEVMVSLITLGASWQVCIYHHGHDNQSSSMHQAMVLRGRRRYVLGGKGNLDSSAHSLFLCSKS